MLPIKFIRENTELVKENTKKRMPGEETIVDELLKTDEEWRATKSKLDELRHERNKISEAINKAKKQGEDIKPLVSKAKELPGKIKELETKAEEQEKKLNELLRKIPNILHPEVPIGESEKDNVVRKKWGEPKKTEEIINHAEFIESTGLADFDTSAKVSGKGFYYLKGDLALLNQALIRFAIEFMVKKGYEYIEPPLMIRRKVIDGVMTFKEIDDMIYKIENEDLYLIGTSEHSLIGMFINKTIKKEDLPLRLTSYSICFRKEIGSHGIDEKGLWRTHQFNKVEQVIICTPEQSWEMFEELLKNGEEILQALELPYRVLEMCTGDLGLLKARQMDLEVWLPRKNDYGEVGSCSNLTGAQATRLNIKYIDRNNNRDYCHTLNNTALATSRIMVALIENNQQPDGRIRIPKALRPYVMGKEYIEPKKKIQ